jgi:hypothetical protein
VGAAGWGWNGLFVFAVVDEHRHAPGHAIGIAQAGLFAGSFLGPLVFGQVADSSYRLGWLLEAAAVLAAAASVLAGRALLSRARVAEPAVA